MDSLPFIHFIIYNMKRLIQTTAFELLTSNDLRAIHLRGACDSFYWRCNKIKRNRKRSTIFVSDSLLYSLPFANNQPKGRINNWDGEKISELLHVIDTELELWNMRMQGVLSSSPPSLQSHSFCIRRTGKATDLAAYFRQAQTFSYKKTCK